MSPLQWSLWSACLAIEVTAATLAFLLARRDRQHRPVAALLVFAVVLDVALRASQALIIEGAPREGLALVAFRANDFAVTAWPTAVSALAWWSFCGPKANGPDRTEPPQSESYTGVDDGSDSPRSMPLGSLAVKVLPALWLLANAYGLTLPPKGCPERAAFLQAVTLGAAGLAGLAAMLGWRRHRERPAVVALTLAGFEALIGLVGPYVDKPWEPSGWDTARVAYVICFGFLAGVQWRWMRDMSRR